MNEWFCQEEFTRLRAKAKIRWGRPVRVFDTLPSTNDTALEAVSGDALTGIVWLAKEQSLGRGRRGNSWTAAPGECLMLSTLVRYDGPQERLAGVSLVVGLALRDLVCECLSSEGIERPRVEVKWPNDIMVDGKKLAGILVETRTNNQDQIGIVVGVGLNTLCAAFPPELPSATSLRLLGLSETACRPEPLLAAFLKALEVRFPRFLQTGIGPSAEELRACDFLKGRKMRVGKHLGEGAGIDDDGQLLLLKTDGSIRAVASGHVELLMQPPPDSR